MNDLTEYAEDNAEKLEQLMPCILELLEKAWAQNDKVTVSKLTNFNDFLEKGNQLDVIGYLENLKKLGVCPSLWYYYLKLVGSDCVIHENNILLLHDLLKKVGADPIDLPDLISNIHFLIRRFSASSLNLQVGGFSFLNKVAKRVSTLNCKLEMNLKRHFKYIAVELLKNGADPSIVDNDGIAFNQTLFYKQHQKRFEEAQKLWALRSSILEAYEIGDWDKAEELTQFSDFVKGADQIDLDNYLEKLNELNVPHILYNKICFNKGINYQDNTGCRYLRRMLNNWIEEGYEEKKFSIINDHINRFPLAEFNKTEESFGSILDFVLDLFKEGPHSNLGVMLKLLIEMLIIKGIDLQLMSSNNRDWLMHNSGQFSPEIHALIVSAFQGTGPSKKDKAFKHVSSLKINNEIKNKLSVENNRKFHQKYGKQIGLLSMVGIAACYISYRIFFGQNKTASSSVKFKK